MIGVMTRVFVRGPEGEKKFFNDKKLVIFLPSHIKDVIYIYI